MSARHISVVIPVFNEEKYIGACLDALCLQTRKPDIVYIIDNNSTDRSIAIAKTYSFVEIIAETTQGICAATKKGLDTASQHGGIIARCDADCLPGKNWIEHIETIFSSNTSISAVTGPGKAYDTNKVNAWLIDIFYMKPYFSLTRLALKYTPVFGSNFALKSTTWSEMKDTTHLFSHQNIHDDIDLSYHINGLIQYDPTLEMPISARPFRTPWKLPARYIAGFRSIFIHWPEKAPWR